MKLVQLSTTSIIVCLLGLAGLTGVGLASIQHMRAVQRDVVELLELQGRIADFSVASDQILLYPPHSSLWEAYRADAQALRELLLQMGTELPAARRTAQHVERIVEMLDALRAQAQQPPAPAPDAGGPGPLEMPLRSRMIITELANHGIAVDTTLDHVLRQRQALIAREATWIAAGFGGAALLFGAGCIIAFGLIHRRISGPARALEQTFLRLAAGDRSARVPERGSDEFAQLARTFNHMLDRRQQAEERLDEYRALVEGSRNLYAIIDADHRYVLANRAYIEAYGFDPDNLIGTPLRDLFGDDFFEREVKPRVDRALAGETNEFEAERDYRDRGRSQVLIRYEPIADSDGRINRVGCMVTDVTELKRAETELRKQARLLDMAGRIGRFGGWAVDLPSERVEWSDVVAEIHDMPHGYSPAVEEGIGFCAPEYHERIRERFTACAEKGTPFDEELEIITARGKRRWVRSVGVPVRDEADRIVRVEGAFQDITGRKESELEAERLSRRLATMLESITDAFIALDRQWRFSYVNAEAEQLIGRTADELLGRNVWDEYPDITDMKMGQACWRAMEERVTVAVEEYYPSLGKWFDIRAYPSEEGLALFFRDVTERHEMVERLREHERELEISRDQLSHLLDTRQALINSLPAHIALLDGEGTIIEVNDQWRRFARENAYAAPDGGLGLNYLQICRDAHGDSAEEAAAAAEGLRQVLAGECDIFSLEYPCHSPEQHRWFRMLANRLSMADEATDYGAVVMHVDITERKLAEQELRRIVHEDPVTRALTRHGFVEAFRQRRETAGWDPGALVVMLDIEGQRNINDAHGYEVGDRVLGLIVERLRERAGTGGLVARTGGDEFVVYLPSRDEEHEKLRQQALASAFDEPFRVNELQIEADARFGHTRLGKRPRDAETLLREAELALFEVRSHSGSTWGAYTAALDQAAHARIEMTRELRRALDEGQFQLHFQPKVALDSGRLIGAEALLRWFHPQRGLISPGDFIPVAEQSQLMGPIGDWALFEACRHLREWQDAGLDVVRVAVNVSVVQFRLGRFVDKVREAIAAHGIEPGGLTLEITESVFERESETLREQLRELHDIGVRLSLDDFGTGYSSLLYLQMYPFDEIKVDQGFVGRILDDPYSRKIVTTVLGIAGALGADAVAEGIESRKVCDALLEMGCHLGQGYYYSVPLAVEDFRWLLEKKSVLPLQAAPRQRHGG